MSPAGDTFNQKMASDFAKYDHIVIIAGRFEGFDERIKDYVDKTISIGSYILCGGEIPALAIVESISRLIPGVLGNPLSPADESFSNEEDALEYPQYTKPEIFDNKQIPQLLKSGNHGEITKWRKSHRKK
jgi:tRNA (guanine37-N1)-methyltransferase